MPLKPIGKRRQEAIKLRIGSRLSTCEIARRVGVSFQCAKRYVDKFPLTEEEKSKNFSLAMAKRAEGYVRKPKKIDLERQRIYTRKHYRNNRRQYYARNERKAQEIRNVVRELKSKPCMDCGNSFHFSCMDFDHRGEEEKYLNVSQMNRYGSLKKILAEIAKCDLVCANCHRIRTYNRMMAKLEAKKFVTEGL